MTMRKRIGSARGRLISRIIETKEGVMGQAGENVFLRGKWGGECVTKGEGERGLWGGPNRLGGFPTGAG